MPFSEADTAGEKPDVIDLTRAEEETPASDEETSSDESESSDPEQGPGWTDAAWQLLWGRRKDQ